MLLLDSGQNSLNPKHAHRFDLNRPDFKPYGFTCELWKAAPMLPPDRHNEIELDLLKSGSLTYLLGGERITLEEGRLGAFWAALTQQIIGSEKSPHYFVITLPLPWFLPCQLPAKLVVARRRGIGKTTNLAIETSGKGSGHRAGEGLPSVHSDGFRLGHVLPGRSGSSPRWSDATSSLSRVQSARQTRRQVRG